MFFFGERGKKNESLVPHVLPGSQGGFFSSLLKKIEGIRFLKLERGKDKLRWSFKCYVSHFKAFMEGRIPVASGN